MKFESNVRALKSPLKSLSDKKEYKFFKLVNGLSVLLIKQQERDESDEEICMQKKYKSNLAAVAMCISGGCFVEDSHAYQGLAHLLEHMIFMGSQKYPKENEFDQYISAHSGYDNAYTESEYTLFHFDIIENHLSGALDRFSQLFIEPLMSLDSMQREIIAVESEFQNNINDDEVRVAQIYASMICDNHPASNFIWGNTKTLKCDENLHQTLHEFRRRNYTAEKMFLCIQSGIEFSRLERSVISMFSNIPRGKHDENVTISSDPFRIFKRDFHEKMFFVKSTAEKCKVLMTFLFPTNEFNFKFLEYIASLIQNEGPGSLCDYFMDEMLALKVKARVGHQNFERNSYFTFFTIEVNLTSKGFEDFDLILEALFAYLLLLKSTKIEEHEKRYREFREIQEISFRYKKEKQAIENVQDVAVNMKYCSEKDILIGKEACPDFNADILTNILSTLNENKFNLLILTDKYCKPYEMKEKWFGTEYSIVEYPQKYRTLWNERWLKNELYLPKENEFVCRNFGIFHNPSEREEKYPRKIFENESCECYFKMDKTYNLPYAYVNIYFTSPLTQVSVENLNFTSIYSMCVKNFLSEKLYASSLAGYSFKLNSVDAGLILKVSGFNEKLPMIIDIITKEMKSLSNCVDKRVFETFRKELKKNCHNCLMDLNILNDDYRLSILKRNHRSFFERFKQIDALRFQDFKHFSFTFLDKLSMKILIQGNIVESRAQFMRLMIQSNMKVEENRDVNEELPIYQLPCAASYVKVKSMRPMDHNSVIKNYYQVGKGSVKDECLTEFLVSILSEPLFDILRTHQQLGYGISCSFRKLSNVLGITITVEYQENHIAADTIDEKIEEFLHEYKKSLATMSDEDFIAARRCFISSKLTPDTDLEMEVARNFEELRNGDKTFNRNILEAIEIEKASKTEIIQFYEKVFTSNNARKLSVQVMGSVENGKHLNATVSASKQNVIIDNIKLFQESITTYT